jgi:DNA adenine methylase
MKYVGSKARIAEHILPIILRGRKQNQYYVEPFVGGANVIDKVTGPRIGSDTNRLLISMWKALQNGWVPPTNIDRATYERIRRNTSDYPPELVCFVGHLCSYSGKWWGSYADDPVTNRNYAQEGYLHLMQQLPFIKDIDFRCCDYRQLAIPPRSIIYCDPPYQRTYDYQRPFNHKRFWLWVRQQSILGHRVYVSEYEAPSDFVCVWQMELLVQVRPNHKSVSVERLFRWRGTS